MSKAFKKFKEYMSDFIKTKEEDIKYNVIDEAEYNVLTAIEKSNCFSEVYEKLQSKKELQRYIANLRAFIEDELE